MQSILTLSRNMLCILSFLFRVLFRWIPRLVITSKCLIPLLWKIGLVSCLGLTAYSFFFF